VTVSELRDYLVALCETHPDLAGEGIYTERSTYLVECEGVVHQDSHAVASDDGTTGFLMRPSVILAGYGDLKAGRVLDVATKRTRARASGTVTA
jgi:hypothetical protein